MVGHVEVDEGAVVHYLALGGVDKAHATHVGRQLVDLIEGAIPKSESGLAVLGLSQVEQQELVGRGGGELVLLDIHSPDPVAFLFEFLGQVATDKATGAAEQGFLHKRVSSLPRIARICTNLFPIP